MNIHELHKIIVKIEANPKIYSIKHKNYSLWAMVKYGLHAKLITEIRGERISRRKKILERLSSLMVYKVGFYKAKIKWRLVAKQLLRSIKKPIALVFLESHYTYENDQSKSNPFGSMLFDNELANFETIIFDSCKSRVNYLNLPSKKYFRENFIDVFGPSIYDIYYPNRRAVIKLIGDLLEVIKETIPDHPYTYRLISENIFKERVIRVIYSFDLRRKRALKVLKKMNPFCLILTNSSLYQGVISAARDLGIHVIEFQHGVIHKYHPNYCWSSSMNDRKVELMLPNQIFMWGKYWVNENLEMKFWNKDQLIPIGFQKISELKDQFYNLKVDEQEIQGNITFLYTSGKQTRDESIIFFGRCLEHAEKNSLPFHLNIKLHPNDDSDYTYYSKLEKDYPKNCKVFYHHEKSLYEHFKNSHVHLSVYSASIFESITLGLPTAIINLSAKEFFSNLISKGLLKYFETPEELSDYAYEIKNCTKSWQNFKKNTKDNSEYFFEDNTKNLVVDHLNSLLTKK